MPRFPGIRLLTSNGTALAAPLLAGLLLLGCSTQELDRQVAKTLRTHRGQGQTANSIEDGLRPEEAAVFSGAIELNRTNVLYYAVRYSRDLQNRRDTLYNTVLELYQQRRSLGLGFDSAVLYESIVSGDQEGAEDARANLEVTDTLFSGARLRFGASGERDIGPSDSEEEISRTRFSASVDQPLLAGFGYSASHEALIQAEHNLVYALRDFALERQDAAIRTLDSFYDLVFQEAQLKNRESNVQQSSFLRERSEAMFKVQLAPYIDVLRSKQQELSSRNQLQSATSQFAIAKQRFLISLGLPKALTVSLKADVPALKLVKVDQDQCIDIALANRLDLLSAEGRHADVARRLKTARQALLPDLNLTGEASLSNSDTNAFSASDFQEEVKVGVQLEIPLDNRAERDALKKAKQELARSDRDLAALYDTIRLEVSESLSRLGVLANNVAIEQENVTIAEERVENAVYRFKSGELSNRDVVEAENALLLAKDSLVRALIDHEIERYQLLRNIGYLDVSTEGQFIEKKITS